MNIRFTLLLLVLVVFVGGLVGMTQWLRFDDNNQERGERLYRVNASDLATITITQDDDEISFVQIQGNWFIEDKDKGEIVPVDIGRWGGVPLLISGPVTQKNLTDDVKDLKDLIDFGLEPPRSRINLTSYTGQNVEVLVGSESPGEDGYYAKVVGTEPLYVVHSSWVEVLLRLLTEPPYPPDEA